MSSSKASTTKVLNFPGPVISKRRRMRSGGNVSTRTNNTPKGMYIQPQQQLQPFDDTLDDDPANDNNSLQQPSSTLDDDEDISQQKVTQTSKCKGATTIPIFLKKCYKLVDTCDPNICSWTEDGDMFVVKDPDIFASQVIPQYFDHNKFSSFARQLNFYGFRKMQSKPIRNSDFDAGTAKHVTFYNENFKRGRCDLLKKIQRSTRGGGPQNPADQSREIASLREQVMQLEQKIEEISTQTVERIRRLELDMLARNEQMMLTMQAQQRTQLQLEKATSVGTMGSSSGMSNNSQNQMPAPMQFDQYAAYQRTSSISSAVNSVANAIVNGNNTQQHYQAMNNAGSMPPAPTLPPHPKQKHGMPFGTIIPGSMAAPPDRMNSLRGISTLSTSTGLGGGGLTRGDSIQSSSSAVLMRNSWEDKFFSMLMLDSDPSIVVGNNDLTSNGMGTNLSSSNGNGLMQLHQDDSQQQQQQQQHHMHLQQQQQPLTTSMDFQHNLQKQHQLSNLHQLPEADELSDVSSPDLS